MGASQADQHHHRGLSPAPSTGDLPLIDGTRSQVDETVVLVVEDDEYACALVQHLLRAEGIDTRCASSGGVALQKLEDEVIDMVLLDTGMPDLNGLEVLQQIRSDPSLDMVMVVLVTSRQLGSDAATAAGADAIVSKPVDPAVLLRQVSHQLRGPRAWRRQFAESTELAADVRAVRSALRQVIEGERHNTVFQPIVDLDGGHIVGAEALTRFEDGHDPHERFAAAARCGMGTELELATLRAGLLAAQSLPANLYVSVNISASLACAHLADVVGWARDREMVLELTENERIEDYEQVTKSLRDRHPSVRVAVDDAGAGWASLRRVLALRPDLVTLDREWIRGIDADVARQALVLGIDTFAESFGGSVVAEGVETAAELRMLHSLGIPYAQGYHLGRPVPAGAWV